MRYVNIWRCHRDGVRYRRAGIAVAQTLLSHLFRSRASNHKGLAAVTHVPLVLRDRVPDVQHVANGESAMQGRYYLCEEARF